MGPQRVRRDAQFSKETRPNRALPPEVKGSIAMTSKKVLIVPVAAVATLGLLAGTAASAEAAALPAANVQHRPSGAQADKFTQVHMRITNSTNDTLTLTTATDKGDNAHWQNRPTDLAAGQTISVSNYAADEAEIDLTYTDATTDVVFNLHAVTPGWDNNVATGSTNNAGYTVTAQPGSGESPLDTFALQAGHTFAYTGGIQTYTVPAGVTELNVTGIGGGGGVTQIDGNTPFSGAQISGTLAVTPGEILTIGVGGVGHDSTSNAAGGWGMNVGSSNYGGGTGVADFSVAAGGGGGATVVLDGNGNVVAVAGGGGGQGAGTVENPDGAGGEGGYQGSLTGQNGGPHAGEGGNAGAYSTPEGQSVSSAGDLTPGAGGGGVNGGDAGISGTSGGGGAGSSADGGLTNPTVEAAPQNDSVYAVNPYTGPGQVILTVAN
jgi:hypothetical protein